VSGNREGNNTSCESASATRSRGVKDPRQAEKLHAREPGDLVAARGRQTVGRRENAMPNLYRTPRRETGSNGLERVREAAMRCDAIHYPR
jgi:hypothetical protein